MSKFASNFRAPLWRSLALLLALPLASAAEAQTLRPGYNRDVIYQVFVDRFFDANAANNYPADPLFDPAGTNLQKYLGGDFQGLTAKMGYLQNICLLYTSDAADE